MRKVVKNFLGVPKIKGRMALICAMETAVSLQIFVA